MGIKHIYAAAALVLLVTSGGASCQPVTFEGETFVNKGLVGVARISSTALDEFGETLGGIGSSMAMDLKKWKKREDGTYTGELYMMPDRGWNTQGTVDYRGRLQHFDIKLDPFSGAGPTGQDQLAVRYRNSIVLNPSSGQPTTGLDPSGVRPPVSRNPELPIGPNGLVSFDGEGLVHVGDDTVWVSDEYGPYIYHYTLHGSLLDVIRPPDAFIPMRKDAAGKLVENFSANSPPHGSINPPNFGSPLSGRQNNQGFEGLAMSPDRKTLFVLLQSALIQDLNPADISTTRRNTRLLAYDLRQDRPRLVGEYVVQLPVFKNASNQTRVAAQSEFLALNDHQFLVIARDSGAGFTTAVSKSEYRRVDLIDIAGATNIANTAFDEVGGSVAPLGVLNPAVKAVKYQTFIDINDNAQLNRFGLHNGDPNDRNDLYEKWESLAVVPVGDRDAPNDYFLFLGSDNDYMTTKGFMTGFPYSDIADVDSLILVYRVTLPTYVPPVLENDGDGKEKVDDDGEARH